MPELPREHLARALPLVPAGFGIARAVTAGRSRGRVWVDDLAAPASALIATIDGCVLTGPGGSGFEAELREVLERVVRPGGGVLDPEQEDELVLTFQPGDWEPRLSGLFGGRDLLSDPRRYYELAPDDLVPCAVPSGYELRQVDLDFLRGADAGPAASIREWIESHHQDLDQFLADCAATVLTHEGAPAGWSVTDCRSERGAEVGIVTEPAHRRRGLATAAAAATCARLFELGVERVGWHCYARNEASVRTATRLGFRPMFDYPARFVMFDPQRHELVRGWCLLELEDDPAAALAQLRPLLTEDAEDTEVDGPWFALAARAAARTGELDAVFAFLHTARARGWDDLAELAERPELEAARNDPRWARLH